MSEQEYFRCRNWHKFQHYADGSRRLLWVKNWISLDDPSDPFTRLSFADQGKLQAIWRLAAKFGNVIEYDAAVVARHIRARDVPLERFLAAGWLQVGTKEELKKIASAEKRAAKPKKAASKQLAARYQDASPEVEVEVEKEKEPPSPPLGKVNCCPECSLPVASLPKSMTLADHRWVAHGVEAIDGRSAA